MQDFAAVALRVLPAFGLACLGGAISSAVAVSHQRLCRLISFAAGTLLGVTIFSIIPEVFAGLSILQLIVALGSGYLVFLLISRYVFHVCPACAASHFDETTTHRFSEIATAMIIALGLHSTMDGLALALGHDADVTGGLDLSLLLAICVHKIPEGLTLGALLLASGFKRGVAMAWVAAVEATTLLGGAIGLWLAPQVSDAWLDLVIAHLGGGFLFLAFHAVFGELLKHSRAVVLVNFAFGTLLIGALNLLIRIL